MKYLILAVALFALTACTTTVPVEMTPERIQKLNMQGSLPIKGKKLIIIKNDNTELKGTVISTTENSIVTNKGEIFYADIREIEITRIDKDRIRKNAGIGLGVSLAIGVVAFVTIINGI